ncbi:cytoplasmic dynein 2 light intermediate chain 1 isoform X2 [Halyomorpha halys]|uniref:cytoplasmic dynein 2 light intermediate chain 1 isoform X2 n=1 Tax=Halyomorpha halys TaxID=286706 RepID=UPI0034D222DB
MERSFPELKLPGDYAGTLLDYAVQEILKKGTIDPEYIEPHQKSILFVGNTSSGKTSLIQKFYGTIDSVEPTFMLDYFPSPEDYITIDDDTTKCHIWELGGGILYEEALTYLIDSPNLTVCLCLNLSKPQFLYYTQEEVLGIVLKFLKDRSDFKSSHKSRVAAMPNNHSDAGHLKPFPFPLIIIGTMYDVFYKFEPEKKRIITQFMRYLSHLYGAYLFYWTDRNNEIIKHAKNILKHYSHGDDMIKMKKTDYNRAVYVSPYSDNLTEIDPIASKMEHSLEKYRLTLEAHFPQERISKSISEENPADNPKYAELLIDLIREEQLQKQATIEYWSKKFEEEEREELKLLMEKRLKTKRRSPLKKSKNIFFRKFINFATSYLKKFLNILYI